MVALAAVSKILRMMSEEIVLILCGFDSQL